MNSGGRSNEEKQFEREARLLASLDHPGIVKLLKTFRKGDHRFMVIEGVEGETLASLWETRKIDLDRALKILHDAALTIAYANSKGILHRSLSPETILVDGEKTVRIVDFGFAKTASREKESTVMGQNEAIGSAAYMSPEQAEGVKELDCRTDVYSLGAILYELLAGEPPFVGKTPVDTLRMAVTEPLESPASRAVSLGMDAVDRVLEKICLKALARSRDDRFQKASDFAAMLALLVSGETCETR